MNEKKTVFQLLLMVGVGLTVMPACTTIRGPQPDQEFSFSVVADPRAHGDTWSNALMEIRDRKVPPATAFPSTEFLVAVGDLDPILSRHADFQQVFTNVATRPAFLPVIGNHEFENDAGHFRHARDVLIPAIPGVVQRDPSAGDYYFDHKNVRVIAVDAYTDLGHTGIINQDGRQWVDQVIRAAPADIDHIFIAFHEPAFPRIRHVGDSFDQDPEQRNAFWRMLLEHKDRVRAVVVGHTHSYYRMRVLDPEGHAANDPNSYPDEDGGIYQVDAGAAGNGAMNTIVQVHIQGEVVRFRVLQAKRGVNKPFTEIDTWTINPGP